MLLQKTSLKNIALTNSWCLESTSPKKNEGYNKWSENVSFEESICSESHPSKNKWL